MIEAMMEGYESVFRDRDGKPDDQDEPVTLRSLRRRALGRRWKHLARERLEDLDLSLPLGRKFWPLRSEGVRPWLPLFRAMRFTVSP
jgi:hypothetical protein